MSNPEATRKPSTLHPTEHSLTPTARRIAPGSEVLVLLLLFAVAALIRLPYVWEVPRFTDELQEVLWSVAIARGEILPLTAVDSYYGPVWSYLLALLFKVFGPSPWLPRLVALLLGASLVVLTYLFARDVAGRWPATVAAGLLVTSGGHIIINSHTARSNSITPLFTTAAIWLVYRALATRRWSFTKSAPILRRPEPSLLVPAGLLLGLALQTHISVVALLPGLALYVLVQGWRSLRSPWPYAAGAAALLGYANMIVYNLATDFSSLRHAQHLQEGYTDGRATDPGVYVTNLGALLQSLARLLSGTIDTGDNPVRLLYLALAVLGVGLLARRGEPLLALASLSIVLILPYFNPRYGPILSGRYLIPLLPLGYTAIGCLLTALACRISALLRHSGRSLQPRPLLTALGLAAVLYPLIPLVGYYREVLDDERTNRPLFALASAIVTHREPDEIVILDAGLEQEELGAGGNDLKAFRMLLETQNIPHQIMRVADLDDHDLDGDDSLLALIEAKKRSQLPRDLEVTPLSPEIESASGSEHRYAVYRLSSP